MHIPWRGALAALLALALTTPSVFCQGRGTITGTLVMPSKVRDFRELKSKDGGPMHPDFENDRFQGAACRGYIDKRIDTSGLKSSFPFDERNPKLSRAVDRCFTSPERFDEWYNDRDTSINRPFLVELVFTVYDHCLLVYDNTRFFPIDDNAKWRSLADPPVPPFGHQQARHPQHNFGFTMEFHSRFTYFAGQNQTFTFRGDDDVFVFINDSLVIDLAGVHMPQTAQVNLDKLPSGFLVDGQSYMLDFFSAERHTTGSNIQISTSIYLASDDSTLILTKPGLAAKRQNGCAADYEVHVLRRPGPGAGNMRITQAGHLWGEVSLPTNPGPWRMGLYGVNGRRVSAWQGRVGEGATGAGANWDLGRSLASGRYGLRIEQIELIEPKEPTHAINPARQNGVGR